MKHLYAESKHEMVKCFPHKKGKRKEKERNSPSSPLFNMTLKDLVRNIKEEKEIEAIHVEKKVAFIPIRHDSVYK